MSTPSDVLVAKLPKDIVDVIKLYTGEGCWRNGKYINIKRIPKKDARYAMLKSRPLIKQVYNECRQCCVKGSVWFKLDTGKFVVINSGFGYVWNGYQYITGEYWEMHYNKERTLKFLR